MNRAQAWKHCPTDDQYGPAGFKQCVMENSKQGNIFRYIMMSASNVFKRDQQQAVINTFWDISKPTDWAYLATDAGKKECNAKRLRRQEDPRDGTHCLPSKKYSPKILGKSR